MTKEDMIITTSPFIEGFKVKKVIGLVSAFTIRTRGVLGQIIGGIEGMFGGKITAYEEELEKAREEALGKIVERAKSLGANAIISVDFETSNISPTKPAMVFSAWGTAVVLERK